MKTVAAIGKKKIPLYPLSLSMLLAASSLQAASIVTVPQGGVGRWDGIAAAKCGLFGKTYAAVNAVCYYPVDMNAKPGTHEIVLYDQDEKRHDGSLIIEKVEYPEIEITLPDDTYIDISDENMARHREERARVLALFKAPISAPRFSLPLGAPTANMPRSEDDFGSRRLFNGKRKSQHTGRDAPVGAGTSIKAVADGTVVLAEDQFFTGTAVYIDHGAGLISMNFHMDKLSVKAGDEVERGQVIGTVGGSGRATGPHLHLGLRWLGARIDPYVLLDSTDKLPSITDSSAAAAAKIDAQLSKEPPETDEVP